METTDPWCFFAELWSTLILRVNLRSNPVVPEEFFEEVFVPNLFRGIAPMVATYSIFLSEWSTFRCILIRCTSKSDEVDVPMFQCCLDHEISFDRKVGPMRSVGPTKSHPGLGDPGLRNHRIGLWSCVLQEERTTVTSSWELSWDFFWWADSERAYQQIDSIAILCRK